MKETRAEHLAVDKLRPFDGHPFKVVDNEEMDQLTWSILTQGLLTPLVVRPLDNGEYEVISGHRRLHACKKAGIETVPALITDMDRDAATIALVDSNLHREKILPSEKAFAYKMKLEAMNRQGQPKVIEHYKEKLTILQYALSQYTCPKEGRMFRNPLSKLTLAKSWSRKTDLTGIFASMAIRTSLCTASCRENARQTRKSWFRGIFPPPWIVAPQAAIKDGRN